MFAPKIAKPEAKGTASSTSNLAHQRSTLAARRPAVQEALLLQRTIGKQAMLRPPAQRASSPIGNEPGGGYEREAAPENKTKPAAASQSMQQVPELEHGRRTGPLPVQSVPATKIPPAPEPQKGEQPLGKLKDRVTGADVPIYASLVPSGGLWWFNGGSPKLAPLYPSSNEVPLSNLGKGGFALKITAGSDRASFA